MTSAAYPCIACGTMTPGRGTYCPRGGCVMAEPPPPAAASAFDPAASLNRYRKVTHATTSSCTCSTAGLCTHCKTTYAPTRTVVAAQSTRLQCLLCPAIATTVSGFCDACDFSANVPPYTIHDDGWTLDENGEIQATADWGPIWVDEVPEKPKCLRCSVELSKTLDAYYGRVPGMADLCVKCRGKT